MPIYSGLSIAENIANALTVVVNFNSIQFNSNYFININTSNTTVQYQIKIMLKGETDRREHNSL